MPSPEYTSFGIAVTYRYDHDLYDLHEPSTFCLAGRAKPNGAAPIDAGCCTGWSSICPCCLSRRGFSFIAAAASSARRTARHRCQSACAMYSGGWQGARQPHANGRPPDRAASRTWAVYFSASTVYCRMILMALLRSGSRSLKACELRYATAWSRLSNSVMPTCLGGSPTNATTFP